MPGSVNERNRQITIKALDKAIASKDINTFFITLTIPRGNDLDAQYTKINTMFKRFRQQLKRIGLNYKDIKQNDITFGRGNKASYHVHLHTLFFIKTDRVKLSFEGV